MRLASPPVAPRRAAVSGGDKFVFPLTGAVIRVTHVGERKVWYEWANGKEACRTHKNFQMLIKDANRMNGSEQ
jgi:hypothetical protein